MHSSPIHLGCAGWSIPSQHARRFLPEGSHLARYAARFPAVEIDSSFYRPHREATYRRWAATVPPGFRFAVKLPREITHRRQMQPGDLFAEFLKGPAALGNKLGALLVQLPPRLALDRSVAEAFFADLRRHFPGAVVCEPRHASWFSPEAEDLLETFHIARAAADPALMPAAADPGGWRGLSYPRLHGSPVMYRSAYPEDFLAQLAARLGEERAQRPVRCIFDNTTALSVVEDFCSRLAVLPYYPGGTPRVNKAPRGSPYLWS